MPDATPSGDSLEGSYLRYRAGDITWPEFLICQRETMQRCHQCGDPANYQDSSGNLCEPCYMTRYPVERVKLREQSLVQGGLS